jgi:branched-chain amino acid transport system permease protein
VLAEQLVVTGLLAGAVYGLVGVGFTLVLGVGRIANFAHGSFVAAGLYWALFFQNQFGLNPYVALLPGVVVFTLVGFGVAELFERRGRRIGEIGELLVGLAILLLVGGFLEAVYTDRPKTIHDLTLGGVNVFGFVVFGTQIAAAVFTFAVAGGLFLFVRYSRPGRALRAVAEDPTAAGLYGVRVPRAQRLSVAVSVALAAVAGIVISPFTTMYPEIGTQFLLTAFAVVIVGGIGNTLGAVLAGLAIGVANSLASGYLASYWTTLAPLILILVFLLFQRESEVAL